MLVILFCSFFVALNDDAVSDLGNARDVIRHHKDKQPMPDLAYAFGVIRKHGSKSDIALLMTLRNDDRVIVREFRGHTPALLGNVSDCAAVLSLKLAGQDVAKLANGAVDVPSQGEAEGWVCTWRYGEDRIEGVKKAWAWLDEYVKVKKK